MKEDVVSFWLAMKLKEKGFRGEVNAYYGKWENLFDVHPALDMNDCDYRASAPTISQVLKWLREEKCISVEPYASAIGWRVAICRAYCRDRCDAGGGTCLKEEVIGYNDGGAFEKYEEAAIAGIEYVIDNLI